MQPEPTPLGGHAQVLVVDDQPSTTMLVHAILERVGYRVDECASGREAIYALSRAHYDLIVLDLNLPDMSGLDLMRDWQAWGSPPVLGITSGITPDLLQRAEAAGMGRVLEKPISGSQLIATAVAAIRDARSTEIVACGGPAIDPIVLTEIRIGNGETIFRSFVKQALADAWQCMDEMARVSATDIMVWHQHAQTLDGVVRGIGARRLASAIAEALPMSESRLRDIADALTRQLADLLGEAQEALGEWLRPRASGTPESSDAAEPTQLSARERAILYWTAAGKTSSETAAILGISGRTVAFHIAKILFKLDAVNKTQAVAKAVMLDLLH
jgi:DNA-binding NarL/FixJ family response regulator